MNDAIRRKIIISNFYYELDKIFMERFNRHITLLDISKLEYIMNLGEEETIKDLDIHSSLDFLLSNNSQIGRVVSSKKEKVLENRKIKYTLEVSYLEINNTLDSEFSRYIPEIEIFNTLGLSIHDILFIKTIHNVLQTSCCETKDEYYAHICMLFNADLNLLKRELEQMKVLGKRK